MPPRHRLAGAVKQIRLRREHDLTPEAARKKVERVADVLAKRFDADCEWDGDVLSIKHPTVSGTVTLGKNDIVVAARLGLMLSMFRGRIDEELERALDREFPKPKA
jgi:putative polyhydroxyalkanoate system protein